jgi:hypothetical protein
MNRILRKRYRVEADWRERMALAFTTAAGVALSVGVIAALVYILMAMASLVSIGPSISGLSPAGTASAVAALTATRNQRLPLHTR